MTDDKNNCMFCKVASGEMGTSFVVETDNVVAFDDISPQAPTHVLVIPRRHITSVREFSSADSTLWGEMLEVANRVAKERGIDESGYRLVTNAGPDSGQVVFHVHLHVLGGKKLGSIA